MGTLASGCGGYQPDAPVLEVSALQPRAAQLPFNQLMWKAVDQFTAEHLGIRVEPASGGGGGYQELMIRVMEGNPPDIMSFATAETGLTHTYIEEGHVLDLTDYLRWPACDTPGATWLDTIDSLYYSTLMYNNRFYAVPQSVISLQLYCNADLYEQAGADLYPETWDQFLENCERLKRLGVAPITQDGMHWYTSWWFDHLAQRLLGTEKVRQALRDPERRTSWSEEGFLQAALMVEEMLDRGFFVEGFSGLTDTESEFLFWRGKAATIFIVTTFTYGRTEIIDERFRLHAFRFPRVEEGKGNPRELIGTVNTLSIPAQARHPELAAEFLRLISSRWFHEQMVEQARLVSPLANIPLPRLHHGLDLILKETEHFHPFCFGLEGKHPFLYRQYWNEWNRFMVAREISATQLVENLEDIFTRYYQTVKA